MGPQIRQKRRLSAPEIFSTFSVYDYCGSHRALYWLLISCAKCDVLITLVRRTYYPRATHSAAERTHYSKLLFYIANSMRSELLQQT